MKKILLAAVVLCSIVFYSCKSSSGDPKVVLTAFFEALSKKDWATAKKLSTAESASMLSMIESASTMKGADAGMDKFDKEKMEFGEVKIDGDKAFVPIKEKGSQETVNFALKKESGEWKVAFDKASLMTMGMEKAKEQNINITDTVNKAMDEMKDMDMDSVKRSMQEAMKSVDSLNGKMKNNP